MKTSAEINLLFEALAKARLDFKPIKKNKTAEVKGTTKSGKDYSYKYNYADLSDIMDAVAPALSKNQLFISQGFILERELIATRILHASGQWIETEYPVIAKGDDMQSIGAGFTFARRYAINGILGISSEEDTDGESEVTEPKEKTRFKTQEPKKTEEKKQQLPVHPTEVIGQTRALSLLENICKPGIWTREHVIAYAKSVLKKELKDLTGQEAMDFFNLTKTRDFEELTIGQSNEKTT